MQLSADVSSGNVVAPFPAAFGGAGGDNEARALPAAAQEPSQVKGFEGLANKGSKRSRRKCAAARPHRDQHSHTQNARLPRHGRDPVLRTPRVRTFINFPGSVVRPCGPGLSSRAHRAERQKVRRGRRGSLRMKGWRRKLEVQEFQTDCALCTAPSSREIIREILNKPSTLSHIR